MHVSDEAQDTCVSYEEEDTCVSYEEEDTCVSDEEEDTCVSDEEEVWNQHADAYVCIWECVHRTQNKNTHKQAIFSCALGRTHRGNARQVLSPPPPPLVCNSRNSPPPPPPSTFNPLSLLCLLLPA